MAINVDNIELGEGTLQVQMKDPSQGEQTDVGATLGAELSYSQEIRDVECGQKMSPILSFVIGEEGKFKIKMLESTMYNLALALGLAPDDAPGSASGYTYINFGGSTTNVYSELTYTVKQQANQAKNYIFTLYKARVTGGLVLPMSKEEERAYEVEFTLYPDPDQNDRLGQIKKEV